MIVDDTFVSVGSGNFDDRSVRLNDEANLDVLNRSFAATQTRLFETDKRQSRELTLSDAGKLNLVNPVQHAATIASPEL
jgi:cardiolipin synthase A/B